jgi:pentatricopeptide repeat protein
MDAHARSGGGRAAAERAEALLDELEAAAGAGDPSLRPRARTYNAAILAWKNSGDPDAPRRAERLLRRMNDARKSGADPDCRPDRVTLNSIIGAWASSPDDAGAVRAERFLRFMEGSASRGDVPSLEPDAFTYSTCITAYARRNRLRDACRVFRRMRSRRLEQGGGGFNGGLRPDRITAGMLRRALAASRRRSPGGGDLDPDEARRIEADLARFEAGETTEAPSTVAAASTA